MAGISFIMERRNLGAFTLMIFLNSAHSRNRLFKVDVVSQLYPEYYILKVNGFNQVAKSPLEEWIYYLNTGEIPSTATAPRS